MTQSEKGNQKFEKNTKYQVRDKIAIIKREFLPKSKESLNKILERLLSI